MNDDASKQPSSEGVDERELVNTAAREAPALLLKDLEILVGNRTLLSPTTQSIAGGNITVIVGGSGAGKSVLLRTLAGLLPRDGEVLKWFGEIQIADDGRNTQPGLQHADTRRVGIVFQQFALFDELSPTGNVQFAIDHRANRRQPPSQSAKQWLEELGVPVRTRVAALSGGQKQRLAIARTLAADPDVVLYDEPTSGLDSASGAKVAELIRTTHDTHHRTSVVVTHDYETLIPIADEVLLLDSDSQTLVPVPREDWKNIPQRMRPVGLREETAEPETSLSRVSRTIDDFLTTSGAAVATLVRLPFDILPLFPRPKWGLRFFAHYLRLVGGVSAWIYLALAGLIIGFTATYFTFRFLPFRIYTQPLLIDELLASIGFALYRILVPVLATILIAARCGAAVAADVGVKQYGGQVDALQTLGVRPRIYLLVPILFAFLVATPVLEWVSFTSAKWISLLTFNATHPEIGPYFWDQHFYRNLSDPGGGWPLGWRWVMLKNLICGVGTGVIGYYRGLAPKQSASDVSRAITSTVLWTTLFVLVVHFVVALIEF